MVVYLVKMPTLGEYLKSINTTKEDIIVDEQSEKDYLPFIVNRCLSYFKDSALFVNEINMYGNLDKKMQYDFLRHVLNKRNRFSRWDKPDMSNKEIIDALKEYYNISEIKAKEIFRIMSHAHKEELLAKIYKGGITPKKDKK